MPDLFSAERICFRFTSQAPLISNLTFCLQEHTFTAVVGPSGIGKSTLLKLIAGLLVETAGELMLDGVAVTAQQRLGKMVYMPQTDTLLPWRTVAENVALVLELRGESKQQALITARRELSALGFADWLDRPVWELSGGMRQRVGFLRTVLSGARLLLLDEPFSALDGLTRRQMHGWLLQFCQQHKVTVLMITHDLDEALLLADEVLVWSSQPLQQFRRIAVPWPRPRQSELAFTALFAEYKQTLDHLLGQGGDF